MRFRHRVQLAIISLIVIIEGVTIVAVLGMMKSQSLQDADARLRAGIHALESAIGSYRLSLAADAQSLAADPALRRAIETQGLSDTHSILARHDLVGDASLVLYVDNEQRIRTLSGEHSVVAIHFELPIESRPDASSWSNRAPTLAVGMVDGVPQQLMVAPLSSSQQVGWVAVGSRIDDSFASRIAESGDISVNVIGYSDSGADVFASSLGANDRKLLAEGSSGSSVFAGMTQMHLASDTFISRSIDISGASNLKLRGVVAMPMHVAMHTYRAARAKLGLIFVVTFVLSIFHRKIFGCQHFKAAESFIGSGRTNQRGRLQSTDYDFRR